MSYPAGPDQAIFSAPASSSLLLCNSEPAGDLKTIRVTTQAKVCTDEQLGALTRTDRNETVRAVESAN